MSRLNQFDWLVNENRESLIEGIEHYDRTGCCGYMRWLREDVQRSYSENEKEPFQEKCVQWCGFILKECRFVDEHEALDIWGPVNDRPRCATFDLKKADVTEGTIDAGASVSEGES